MPSLPVVTQIRGHIAGPPPSLPPSPQRYVPSFLSRNELSIFFPRRRIVRTHAARRSQQLIHVCEHELQRFCNSSPPPSIPPYPPASFCPAPFLAPRRPFPARHPLAMETLLRKRIARDPRERARRNSRNRQANPIIIDWRVIN